MFIYDAEKMDYFHDEVFLSPVHFYNNIFYNYSTTVQTPWRRTGGKYENALKRAEFISDPLEYVRDLGVNNILLSAAGFKLKDSSPLIDSGKYVDACGDKDFFGTILFKWNVSRYRNI